MSFTLKKENVNTFNNINNITSELEPLCKEHAIANTCKDTLYGLDKLAASLPTINEQFIKGYNFQIDFTKLYGVNKDKFKEHYRDMLYTVPATKNCLNFKNIELLLQVLDLHHQNIDNVQHNDKEQLINTINNLKTFFNKNRESIIQKLAKIIKNEDDLFHQAYRKQQEEIDIYNLLNQFFNEIENSNKLKKSEKIELFRAFFNNLFCSEYILQKILEIDNITLINKLVNLLKRDDIKNANTSEGIKLDLDKIWEQVSDHYDKGMIYPGKKLECYYDNGSREASRISDNVISPIVTIIKQDTNNSNQELKNELLEYCDQISSIMLQESEKYKRLLARNKSLVPADFWRCKVHE